MAAADIVLVRTQLLEKLMASPRAARYTDAIGTNSDFTVKQQMTDAILQADLIICNDIISTAGHPYRSTFMVASSALDSGDFIPAHTGAHGDVQVAILGIYKRGVKAKSRDEVLAMLDNPTLYGGSSRYYYIEDSIVYHCGDAAKVWYPALTKTAACQAPQIAEPALVYGAAAICENVDSDSEFYAKQNALFEGARAYVRNNQLIPPQEILEAQMRRAA